MILFILAVADQTPARIATKPRMAYTSCMSDNFLIYGSYGYTGNLIARLAVQRGQRPILAGRDAHKLAAQAAELGSLEHFAFSLDDRAALDKAMSGVRAVLLCAGPHVFTASPVVDACLRNGVDYLDITGEIPVFEALAARDVEARTAGVMLLPGVGFDVVPSDCLATHLKRRLPSATRLTIAIRTLGDGISHGTANTAVEMLNRPGLIRRDGQLVSVPAGWRTIQADFGRGPVTCIGMPWGDVATAYYSTGIPNIEEYFAFPASLRRVIVAGRYLTWLLATPPAKGLLRAAIRRLPPGPSAEARSGGLSLLWGEVSDPAGQRAVSRLRTPEAYQLTALTALAAAEKTLAGQAKPGFQTPSLAFGADFILEFAGVEREDLE